MRTDVPAIDLPAPAPTGRKLVFVVTEDWFFASHFLPMARAARELGLEVAVVARVREHRAVIEATGARVIPLEAERRSLNPMAAGYAAGQLAAILKAERPDLVHCIALRPILIGGFAAAMAGIPRRIYALTGLGLLGARADTPGRAVPEGDPAPRSAASQTRQTRYPVREPRRPAASRPRPDGSPRHDRRRRRGRPRPAAARARCRRSRRSGSRSSPACSGRRGSTSRSRRCGSPAPGRRGRALALRRSRSVEPQGDSGADPARLEPEPGIAWHGPTRDVAAVWRDHHVCCLPSRGGEGLPRTLLEGAACGRALVTTDVPGCRTLVRDGVEGLVVPAERCPEPRRSARRACRRSGARSPAWARRRAPACSTASPNGT